MRSTSDSTLEAYEREGVGGLVSKKRGCVGSRKLPEELEACLVDLVREFYDDFGPTLAREKLEEIHGIRLAKETVRKCMVRAGIWLPKESRLPKAHQPRHRRHCFGELVQIDGCQHDWFEGRGPYCTLLVYVDDATGRLMELRFVRPESAFDYFDSTTTYLKKFGRPVAFYSDKHSVFRVAKEGTTGPAKGVSQFGRALADLNIDIICSNTPQAKGRVERMNKTLQDRLVKELRLQGVSGMDEANAFAPAFAEDYNRRFAREPLNPHDAHRPLRSQEDLGHVFSWQEERQITRNLVVNFKRVTYLVEPSRDTRRLAGKKVRVHQWADGRVEIHCAGRSLPFSVFDNNPCVTQGDIVGNKRLGHVLSMIQYAQKKRDDLRLASKKLTLREKEQIRDRGDQARPVVNPGGAAFAAYLENFAKEQKERDRVYNQAARHRRREKELGTT